MPKLPRVQAGSNCNQDGLVQCFEGLRDPDDDVLAGVPARLPLPAAFSWAVCGAAIRQGPQQPPGEELPAHRPERLQRWLLCCCGESLMLLAVPLPAVNKQYGILAKAGPVQMC